MITIKPITEIKYFIDLELSRDEYSNNKQDIKDCFKEWKMKIIDVSYRYPCNMIFHLICDNLDFISHETMISKYLTTP